MHFHIERDAFSSVVDLTLPTIEQALRFYLEPGQAGPDYRMR